MIQKLTNMIMLASGLLGMLSRRRAARKADPAGRPLYGIHYRFSEDTRGGQCGARIEALCPDGVWRAFLWVTNTANPWGATGHYVHESADERARWLSDKFIGPTYMPSSGDAMSEDGVRSSGNIGIWVLDPYEARSHREAGYPFHGEGYPNCGIPRSPSGERLEDIRLLPCYEACRVE